MAFEIDRSDEGLHNLIRDWRLLYLGRAATASELDVHLPLLKGGTSQREAQARIIDTAEYANTPPAPGSGVATRLV